MPIADYGWTPSRATVREEFVEHSGVVAGLFAGGESIEAPPYRFEGFGDLFGGASAGAGVREEGHGLHEQRSAQYHGFGAAGPCTGSTSRGAAHAAPREQRHSHRPAMPSAA